MKGRWMLAGLLAAVVGIVSGCSGGDRQDKIESQESDIAKGRYVEEECFLPEETGMVMALGGTGGENVRMVADTGIYDSADGGKTWQECSAISLEKEDEDSMAFTCAAINSKGDIAIAYREGQKENIKILTEEGVRASVEVSEQTLVSVRFSGDDDVAALDAKENLLMVDTAAGTSADIVPADDRHRTGIECIGDQILIQTIGGAQLYDIKGNSRQTDEILINLVKEKKQQPGISGARNSLIARQAGGEGFFYCSREGLYNYRIGGTTVEKLIDGSMTSIGSPALYLSGMAAKEDGSVLILFIDGKGKPLLKNYVYSERSDSTPGSTLTVYSLYDDPVLRQAVTVYNSSYPDSYAQVVIGTDEKGAVTEADAVRTLNTEILAGNGPDVLIMDGLPVESYIENGILADMGDILKDIDKNDGLFENIARIYEAGGNVYAIPTRFFVPVVAGRSEIVGKVTDLKTLGGQIREIRGNNAEIGSAVGILDEKLLGKLFNISAGAWTLKDGTLNEASLKEFLQEAKDIQDGQIGDADKAQIEEVNNYWEGLDTYLEVLVSIIDLEDGRKELAYIELGSSYNLNQLLLLQKEKGIIYRPAGGQTQNTFVPGIIAGISARSGKRQEAGLFIKTLLGVEVQSMTSIDEELGFPVNMAAFVKSTQNPAQNGSGAEAVGEAAGEEGAGNEIELKWASESEFDTFISMAEKLDNVSVEDEVIKKLVIETGGAYLKDELTLEDAVKKIKDQISIYLAE